MRKLLTLIILCLLALTEISAQEINCRARVNAGRNVSVDPAVYQTMTDEINKFLDEKIWTDLKFEDSERIECSFNISITEELGSDRFRGQLTVQANRPVFNSDYKTTVINFVDKDIEFGYQQFQNLDYNPNTYVSELTCLIAYYVYLIIGMDMDTYSLNGGTSYLVKAQQVVNLAQNSSSKGWKAFEKKENRYWIVENLLNNRFRPLREAAYKYHLKGLDEMYEDEIAGRAAVMQCLDLIQRVHKDQPNSISTKMFFNAKADEITKILSKATAIEKSKAITILNSVDPSNVARYNRILQEGR